MPWPAPNSLLERVLLKRLNIESLTALDNTDCVPGLAVIELQIEVVLREGKPDYFIRLFSWDRYIVERC